MPFTKEQIEKRLEYEKGDLGYHLRQGNESSAEACAINVAALEALLAQDETVRVAVDADRVRAATILRSLTRIWRATAAEAIKKGTFTSRSLWPPFKKFDFVAPGFAQIANSRESAANAVNMAIRFIQTGATGPAALYGATDDGEQGAQE